jgi:hypothetical protein
VQQLSEGQLLFLEYGFQRLEQEQWRRLERTLGTLWEWTDVYNSATGRPLEDDEAPAASMEEMAAEDRTELRMPLASILKPELLQLIRKQLRPPAQLRREGAHIEGEDLSKEEFLNLFGQAIRAVPAAAEAIQDSMRPFFSQQPAPKRSPHVARPTAPPRKPTPAATIVPTPAPAPPRKPR